MPNALLIRCLCRIYGLSLYAYPRPFRTRFGGEMQQLFRDRCRDAANTRRWLRFAWQSLGDWFGTAVLERFSALAPREVARRIGRQVRAVWDAGHDQAPRGAIAEWAFTILAVLFFSTTLVQAYVVPTGSMESTLRVGDHLLVDRVTYANPGVFSRLMPYRGVRHGDLVVILYPEDTSVNYVKRVIGLPGDHIRMENKQVIRNGERLVEPYTQHIDARRDPYRDDFPAAPEAFTTPRGRAMFAEHVRDGELVVPPDTLFVMGDNRDNSSDSRYWGLVPRSYVVGKPLMVYWSFDAPSSDLETWNVPHLMDVALHFFSKTRWDRTFKVPR